MLFERFGSISWTVSFFALEGVAGVAAALASSLVSERPRVSPDEGGNQGPDEGAIRVSTCLTQPKRRFELFGVQERLGFVHHVLLEPDCVGDLQRCVALISGHQGCA